MTERERERYNERCETGKRRRKGGRKRERV